jgi:hypothetical protein
MRSQISWGKYVDELLNERGVVCSRLYTGVRIKTLQVSVLGGKVRVIRLLFDSFPKFFTHPQTAIYSPLSNPFSTLSTPPITIRTN